MKAKPFSKQSVEIRKVVSMLAVIAEMTAQEAFRAIAENRKVSRLKTFLRGANRSSLIQSFQRKTKFE